MSKTLTAEQFKENMFKNKKPFYTPKLDIELMIEFLHGYLFHYNPYTKLWAGFPRELMVDYFNGSENKKIIKMKSAEDLIEYLKELNGTKQAKSL